MLFVSFKTLAASPQKIFLFPQVCLIGDCIGGILGFDAICYNSNTADESRNSSRRGSISSIQVKRKNPHRQNPVDSFSGGNQLHINQRKFKDLVNCHDRTGFCSYIKKLLSEN